MEVIRVYSYSPRSGKSFYILYNLILNTIIKNNQTEQYFDFLFELYKKFYKKYDHISPSIKDESSLFFIFQDFIHTISNFLEKSAILLKTQNKNNDNDDNEWFFITKINLSHLQLLNEICKIKNCEDDSSCKLYYIFMYIIKSAISLFEKYKNQDLNGRRVLIVPDSIENSNLFYFLKCSDKKYDIFVRFRFLNDRYGFSILENKKFGKLQKCFFEIEKFIEKRKILWKRYLFGVSKSINSSYENMQNLEKEPTPDMIKVINLFEEYLNSLDATLLVENSVFNFVIWIENLDRTDANIYAIALNFLSQVFSGFNFFRNINFIFILEDVLLDVKSKNLIKASEDYTLLLLDKQINKKDIISLILSEIFLLSKEPLEIKFYKKDFLDFQSFYYDFSTILNLEYLENLSINLNIHNTELRQILDEFVAIDLFINVFNKIKDDENLKSVEFLKSESKSIKMLIIAIFVFVFIVYFFYYIYKNNFVQFFECKQFYYEKLINYISDIIIYIIRNCSINNVLKCNLYTFFEFIEKLKVLDKNIKDNKINLNINIYSSSDKIEKRNSFELNIVLLEDNKILDILDEPWHISINIDTILQNYEKYIKNKLYTKHNDF